MDTQTFPPQAYSKETISEAFMWLQSQPEDVKSKATHTEALLSLYLRNKSQKYWAAKTNTSINNGTSHFNDELQEIALNLSPSQAQTTSQPYTNGANEHVPETHVQESSTVEPAFNKPPHSLNGSSQSVLPNSQGNKEEHHVLDTKKPTIEDVLDTKSLNLLRRTQVKLNLSSNKEAARLLICLGFEQIKSLLPSEDQLDSKGH